ncbi:hypothetical protein [Streptomyces sp. YIM 130001]|uniref:hypothetical protein n=1 Tax=Streptomyces sp. YIM 130001 TaxID=2259644 RepID=UPI001F0936D4|nr:hypothetical protein [Streptomyces sp. YIM 130001]
MLFAAAMAVTAVGSAVGLAVDDRVLAGAPIWAKPFKFAVSFVAYGLSLAWILSLLPRGRRAGWWAGTVVASASLVEMVLIIAQAARGRRSHFNYATPFDEAVFNAMGGTVVALWAGTVVVAVLLLRARIADRASAWAMRCGIVLALTGAGVGFLMTRPAPGQQRGVTDVVGAHNVGVPDGGPSMPLTGWSTVGGDLRIPHFFGMHALQLLPFVVLLMAALAPRFARLADERVRVRLVLIASCVYAGLFALVLWQALRGQPLLRPDGATLAALGAIVVVAAAGVYGVLRSPGHAPARTTTTARPPIPTPTALSPVGPTHLSDKADDARDASKVETS